MNLRNSCGCCLLLCFISILPNIDVFPLLLLNHLVMKFPQRNNIFSTGSTFSSWQSVPFSFYQVICCWLDSDSILPWPRRMTLIYIFFFFYWMFLSFGDSGFCSCSFLLLLLLPRRPHLSYRPKACLEAIIFWFSPSAVAKFNLKLWHTAICSWPKKSKS